MEDQIASFGDELGAEVGAEELQAQGRLEREVEVVDGLEEREVGVVDGAPQPGLLAVRDLLGDEDGEEVAARPLLRLGALAELAPDATGVGQVQPLEQRVEIDGARIEGEIAGHQDTSAGTQRQGQRGAAQALGDEGGGDAADVERGAEGAVHRLGADLLEQLVQLVDIAGPAPADGDGRAR